MAYAIGSAANFNALYDALATFMVTAGWTLHDTVAARDKVFKSNGADGKLDMYVRLTISTDATNNPVVAAFSPFKAHKYVLTRAYHYWNAATHVGTNEFGRWGPWWLRGDHVGTANVYFARFDAPALPITNHASLLLGVTPSSNELMWGNDGKNKILIAVAGNLRFYNLRTGEDPNIYANPSGSSISCTPCIVHDAANDKDWIYVLTNNADPLKQLYKFDVDAGTWTACAATTWGVTPAGGWLLWDGADTIYALAGAGGVKFHKYSISGNAWTARTDAPANRNASFNGSTGSFNNAIFAPNSLTGIGEDVIYTFLATGGTVIYRYDITANAWRAAGAGALVAPVNIALFHGLIWDHQKYLYHLQESSSTSAMSRLDLTNIGAGFTNLGTTSEGTKNLGGNQIFWPFVCKVRSTDVAATPYWFVGTADGVAVVTKVASKYTWAYLGRFTSFYRSTNMTLSAGASPGYGVTVTVDATAGYAVGDPVVVFDPSNGTSERTTIRTITDGTHFVCNLVNAYTTGSRAGVDPEPWGLAGDCEKAIAALDAAGGFWTDWEAPLYYAEPCIPFADSARQSANARGHYSPGDMRLTSPFSTLSKYEFLAKLPLVYSLPFGAYPQPQGEEIIKFGTSTYRFFPVSENARFTDTRGVVVGPFA